MTDEAQTTDAIAEPDDDDVLELSSLVPKRRRARLKTETHPDGVIYELASPDDFGSRSLQLLFREMTEMDDLWDKEKRSAAEDKRLDMLLDKLTGRLIVGVPTKDVAAIPAVDKRALVMSFFVEIGGRIGRAFGPEAVRVLTGPDTATRSPDSNDSTEATPTAG